MNQNNKKVPSIVFVLIISLAAVALGYLLFKGSPQDASNQSASDNMHGGSPDNTTDTALNGLLGKPMPDIQLADKDGKTYTADNFKGKNTVLFFNEGLMCYPACWDQIAAFGNDPRFNTDEAQAISVVADSSRDWQKAIDKMPDLAKTATLFDKGAAASRRLGLLSLPSSMHKGSLPGHTYILFDKEGIIRYVNDDPNMALANDLLVNKIAELK